MNEPTKGSNAPPRKVQVVFEMDLETGAVSWNIPNGIYRPAFVNALECCKQVLIMQQLGMIQTQQRPGLVLPDGAPLPKLR